MQNKKAVIIGSGIAGLATAIRLRNQQFDVQVYETNSSPGGKVTEFHTKGYRFDCGPSLFTMPQFIEELFYLSDKNILDYFEYEKKEVICNYFYEDGTKFTAFSDVEKFANEAVKVFEVSQAKILRYFENSRLKYEATSSLFLEKSLHKLSTYLSFDTIKAIAKIHKLGIHGSLHSLNSTQFKDVRLVQFFDRFATYNGSSPYLTPGIMSMILHLEQYYGTFLPKGGMYSITKSLYQLAIDIGVKFHFDTKVDRIIVKHKEAVGIVAKGNSVISDLIISNMDVVPTYRKLLLDQKAPEKILQQPRSSSALIFYWGIKKKFPELDLHNIFFSKNYEEEFDYIFEKKSITSDPTVYINITSKNERNDAPNDCENWFVMINVPGNEGQEWDEMIHQARKNILKKLSGLLKSNIEDLIETEEILDPRSIESNTQSHQGSLYGASSNNKYAAFLRHPNFSKNIKNLYFCGGSVHPGGGIPLCLLSGKIVSELIKKDFKS
ncbi:1-hydroxycarotenoid 3,4-desaturase CrtD [Aquimarina sp. 2201CG14-23]|uniref:1-hydroxycarotenoid 3,4-desaturase CrtD n=1 Tax=Aquimarina mycalae TaxID=3040073 RepID=UPI00247805C6|nr:1-hydroxycarotenoid 3,4-desaturase CrtD [Aquimarina sp. 2201CG14-23]MDH7447424.1 phytoene desaturase family protein [Aquimarina sp. 2201CG14-23]